MITPTQEKTTVPPFQDTETPDKLMLNYVEELKHNLAHEAPLHLRESKWGPLAQLLSDKALKCSNTTLFETVLTAIEESDTLFKSLRKRRLDNSPGSIQSSNEPPQEETTKSESLAPPLPYDVALVQNRSQGACPWLDEYIQFSRKWAPEAYEHFHTAVAIWVLSSIAARRVFIPFGPGGEYTPLFIALVATTTQHTKSTGVKIAKRLLKAIGVSWLLSADLVTPQKLLSNMAGRFPKNYEALPTEKQELVRRRYAMSGQVAWFYDEFGQLLDSMTAKTGVMVDFRGILRRFDDCDTEASNDTLTRDLENIEKPYLSLLASMTPADAKPHAGAGGKLWRDGSFARFAPITPPRVRAPQARFPGGEMHFPSSITEPLIAWHKRLGEPALDLNPKYDENNKVTCYHPVRGILPQETCTFGEGVIDAFYAYRGALRNLVYDHSLDDLAGNYGRLPTKALRIAALFASLENKGKIEIRHWAKGQEIAEIWRSCLHEFYAQVNEREPSPSDALQEQLITFFSIHKEAFTIRELRRISRHFKTIPTEEIEKVLTMMIKDGMVTKQTQGKTVTYQLMIEK